MEDAKNVMKHIPLKMRIVNIDTNVFLNLSVLYASLNNPPMNFLQKNSELATISEIELFNPDIHLKPKNKKKLEIEYAHEKDKYITFEPISHKYFHKITNEEYISVTTLIHQFVPSFNADKIIDRMQDQSSHRCKGKDNCSKTCCPLSKYFGMTREHIKKKWKDDGAISSNLGTELHEYIENHFNNELTEKKDSKEYQLFHKYINDVLDQNPNLIPYRTEWIIYDTTYKIAGSIDFVLKDTLDDKLLLIDWKRSKEISFSNNFHEKFLSPLMHLDKCNGNEYRLQLNIYKFIIEQTYDVQVKKMQNIIFYPTYPSYLIFDVPQMEKELQIIMSNHKI